MFRYKSYKKSIIMTALAILLCLVSLTGATLALFTSDIGDGTIGVVATAGSIKVDIVDLNGDSLKNKPMEFYRTETNKDFLFEPGATFYTHGFQIKNADNSIPIKYHLYVSEDTIKELDKDDKWNSITFETFNKAFEIWITTTPGTLEGAQKISDFRPQLGVGKVSETYYLCVKMKETAGNEFQGKKYSGIGVTVYAVQANGEFPSNAD